MPADAEIRHDGIALDEAQRLETELKPPLPKQPEKTALGLLLSAVLASVVMLTTQVLAGWAERHLFALWVSLWVLVFVYTEFCIQPLRRMLMRLSLQVASWLSSAQRARDEAKLWDHACQDHRVLNDFLCAQSRDNACDGSQ